MISIVIPCYNCEATIERAVNSVLKQTYSDFEIILVDNNSVDNTPSILKKLENSFGKISCYFESKKGAPAARNCGLFKAKGEWVQFLDADDELLPGKIEIQLRKATSDMTGLIAGNCIEHEFIKGKNVVIKKEVVQNDPWLAIIDSRLGITSANLFRRKFLIEIGGWDETLPSSQEYYLMFNLLKRNVKVGFDLSFNTIIYKNINSISRSRDENKLKSILDTRNNLRIEIRQYLNDTNQLTKERNKLIDIYLYRGLMRNRIHLSNYAKQELRRFSPVVPLKIAIREYLGFVKAKSKAIIKKRLGL